MVGGKDQRWLRSKALGSVLLVIGILGVVSAGWAMTSVSTKDLLMNTAVEGDGTVTGHVMDNSGAGIENVSVKVVGTDRSTTTGENGSYTVEGVPGGRQVIEYEANGRNTTVITFVSPSANNRLDVVLRQDSSENIIDDTGEMERMSKSMVYVIGSVILSTSFFGFVGSYLAFMRKRYKMVVSASVMSLFSFGFCIGSLLGILAILLVIFAMKDFATTTTLTASRPLNKEIRAMDPEKRPMETAKESI